MAPRSIGQRGERDGEGVTMGRILLAGLIAVSLAGCGGRPRPEGETLEQRLAGSGYRLGERVESIRRYDLSHWEYLDKRHIVLRDDPGRRYLIEFTRPCTNLDIDNALAYSTTLGELTRQDRIFSRGPGGAPEPCPVGDIHALEKVDRAD
ncbi:DUF6491 family protein [Azorhizophilus paspali]